MLLLLILCLRAVVSWEEFFSLLLLLLLLLSSSSSSTSSSFLGLHHFSFRFAFYLFIYVFYFWFLVGGLTFEGLTIRTSTQRTNQGKKDLLTLDSFSLALLANRNLVVEPCIFTYSITLEGQ